MYHDLAGNPQGTYTLSWHSFGHQLDRLQEAGWVVEGFGGMERRLQHGDWPGRYAVLSFDDGYRSFLQVAEMLRDRGLSGTFFLTRDYCRQRPEYLPEAEVKFLAELAELGTHGATHEPLSRQSTERVSHELGDSKRWLEDLTGREVRYMSAPGGAWNRACQMLALEAGYALVGNSVEWWNRPLTVSRTRQVNRVALRTHFGPEQFERILAGDLLFFVGRRLRSLVLAVPRVVRGVWEVRRRAR
jgi:peptidoglycan/xylan/chitin deacetylase (PgdA/CDA1 family)